MLSSARTNYAEDVVEQALLLVDLYPSLSNATVAKEVGVLSKETIRTWKSLDMSPEARDQRHNNKGKYNRILTHPQCLILAGRIVCRDLLRLDTSTNSIQAAMVDMFSIRRHVFGSFITRFLERNHLSMRSAITTHPAELSKAKSDELISYFTTLRELGLPPSRVVNIDPTSVYSDARFVLQAGMKGRYLSISFIVACTLRLTITA